MEAAFDLHKYRMLLDQARPITASGKVCKLVGLIIEADGPFCTPGSICEISTVGGAKKIRAEVVGFREKKILMMPLEDVMGVGPGSRVRVIEETASVPVGEGLLGRVIDGLGNPIDGKGPVLSDCRYPLYAPPVNPFLRKRIGQPLDIGVRAINGLLTVGKGQRIGIFSGSGIGKSVLLGMIARYTAADINVIGLIGERGREVNEFVEKVLGEEGLKKSTIIAATSDHLPLIRMRGAFLATAIAEYFRDQGRDVNLIMDSVTRFAMAQREIGLSVGEPPASKGYTPSVFALLPKLLERAGTCQTGGSITGLYTVLVEGDDMNEPVADAVRSILDGHVVLTRELAMQGHYPAIDVLKSVSRVMNDVTSARHRELAVKLKAVLATHRRAEDLINIGAYAKGSNPAIDFAIEKVGNIQTFLRQSIEERADLEESIRRLEAVF
jgi:flagellum-specific ATP synthase